jgi:hypothetical protein
MKRKHGSDAVLSLFWKDLVPAGIFICAPLQSSWVGMVREKIGRIFGYDAQDNEMDGSVIS